MSAYNLGFAAWQGAIACCSGSIIFYKASRSLLSLWHTCWAQLLSRIRNGGLLSSFLHEDSRFAKVLRTFPLFVVKNEGLGLLGAREYAVRLLRTPELCVDHETSLEDSDTA